MRNRYFPSFLNAKGIQLHYIFLSPDKQLLGSPYNSIVKLLLEVVFSRYFFDWSSRSYPGGNNFILQIQARLRAVLGARGHSKESLPFRSPGSDESWTFAYGCGGTITESFLEKLYTCCTCNLLEFFPTDERGKQNPWQLHDLKAMSLYRSLCSNPSQFKIFPR